MAGSSKWCSHHPSQSNASRDWRHPERPLERMATAASSEGVCDQRTFEEGDREGWCCCQACHHHCHEEQKVAAMSNCGMLCEVVGIIDDSFQRAFVYIYCHEGWRVYSKSTLINDNAVTLMSLAFYGNCIV